MRHIHRFSRVFALTLPLFGILHSRADELIKPDNPAINYYGRFETSASSSPIKFNWPGSTIEASCPGPSISIELNDGGAYFDIDIDGMRGDSLPPSSSTRRTIATNLSDSFHIVRIILRTNGQTCSFGGFYLADGKQLGEKPLQPARKIEFIGDSWTAGDVTLQKTTPSDLRYFEASLSYARLTSTAFHAQDMLIARGGCGLVNSYPGSADMQTRYLKTLCDGTANWNFSAWKPDLVVIFLGINDFNNGTTDAAFKSAYTAFISTVRGNYPGVPVILGGLAGNILDDVNAVAKSGTGIHTFSSPVTLSNASALWQHPTPQQHRLIADSLIPVVKAVTGWDTALAVSNSTPYTQQMHHPATTASTCYLLFPRDAGAFPEIPTGNTAIYDCRGRRLTITSVVNQYDYRKNIGTLPAGVYLIRPARNAR